MYIRYSGCARIDPIKSERWLLKHRGVANVWGGDPSAEVHFLFARLQRHCPIPLTPVGTPHRPPRLVLGAISF